MSDDATRNGDSIEVEIPPTTAPVFPIERTLNNSKIFFQKMIGGGMLLKIVPLIATPNGNIPHPEAVCVIFGEAGWEQFKREVAADGASPIQIVSVFPKVEGFLGKRDSDG